jgi:hypothetical protein
MQIGKAAEFQVVEMLLAVRCQKKAFSVSWLRATGNASGKVQF